MFILLVKKEFPSLSYAKHIYVEVNSYNHYNTYNVAYG